MWENEMDVARHAAGEAAKILKGFYGHVNRITKKGDIDLVTEADLQSEKAIMGILSDNFPKDGILAEESGESSRQAGRRWIIDPLDGTTNFAHTFSFYAISIALEVDGEIVLGLVSVPEMDERFEAIEGNGAFLNGNPIRVSKTEKLEDALLATGFPYDIRERPDEILDLLRKMLLRAQGIRRPGSAAIDLCCVAAGRFDGFWEKGLSPWDVAAGALIVREAGGIVTSISGAPFSPFGKSVLAANPQIHKAMLEVFKE